MTDQEPPIYAANPDVAMDWIVALIDSGQRPAASVSTRVDTLADAALALWQELPGLCPHLTIRQPTFLPMWAPQTMLCLSCMTAYSELTKGTVEDERCDVCRRLMGELRPILVRRSLLVITGGICGECFGPGF